MGKNTKIDIVAYISLNPQQSFASISETSIILRISIHQFLKKKTTFIHTNYNLHKYCHWMMQAETLEFCEKMCEEFSKDSQCLRNICFSNEFTFLFFFFLNGDVNMQNIWFWCDSNPHIFKMSMIQGNQKINVLAGNLS